VIKKTLIRRRRFVWLALVIVPVIFLGAIAIMERMCVARFDRVAVGMSETEVLSILGPPESAPGPTVRLWSSPLDNGLAIRLDDAGKVSEKNLGPMIRPMSWSYRMKYYVAAMLQGRWPQPPTPPQETPVAAHP
jgi:hypothetical protein